MKRIALFVTLLASLLCACNDTVVCDAPTVQATCHIKDYSVTPFFADGTPAM